MAEIDLLNEQSALFIVGVECNLTPTLHSNTLQIVGVNSMELMKSTDTTID
jgi:hypothetical protein